MHISGLKKSNYLTRSEVGPGVLVTIKEIFQENVAKEGAPEELKWCISFHELEKPMVLNSTNGQIIAQVTKSEETDAWPGHKVVLYDDPNVSFGGKLVGGIRVRAPRGQASKPVFQQPSRPAPAPAPTNPKPLPFEPEPDPSDLAGEDSSVPF